MDDLKNVSDENEEYDIDDYFDILKGSKKTFLFSEESVEQKSEKKESLEKNNSKPNKKFLFSID